MHAVCSAWLGQPQQYGWVPKKHGEGKAKSWRCYGQGSSIAWQQLAQAISRAEMAGCPRLHPTLGESQQLALLT